METPRRLVFVVQTVGGVEVEFPRRRGRRLLFVIQTICGVEGEAGRAVRLVVVRRVVVVVVVPRRLPDVVVRVSRHGAARHGAELVRVVRVVVGVHGRQVRAALHPAKIRARRRGGVTLAVRRSRRRRLAVRHRVGGRASCSGGRYGALHAGGAGGGGRVGQHGRRRGRGDGRRAPDGRHRGGDGGRGADEAGAAEAGGHGGGGGGRRGGGGGAGHGWRRELTAAL